MKGKVQNRASLVSEPVPGRAGLFGQGFLSAMGKLLGPDHFRRSILLLDAADMNLNYVHQMMVDASQRERPGILVTDLLGCGEVEQMAAAGLIEVSKHGTNVAPAVKIERLTDLGRSFLRVFPAAPPAPIPAAEDADGFQEFSPGWA